MAIKVKAINLGYYNHIRQKPGAIFVIRNENEFSQKWMSKVEMVDDSFAPKEELTNAVVTEENQDLAAVSKGAKGKGWKKLEADKPSSVI